MKKYFLILLLMSAMSNLVFSQIKIDMKPSLDKDKPQKLDIDFERAFQIHKNNKGILNNVLLEAKAYLSTAPDSNTLNSIKLNTGYQFLTTNIDLLKFLGVSAKIGTEHPQNFSSTNLKGSLVVNTVLPYSDLLARIITKSNGAIVGIIVAPAIEFVKNTSYKDSTFARFAIHANLDFPVYTGQNINLYGVAYYQDGFRPRTYIEATIEQKVSESLYIIAKWVNGELPPIFKRECDLRIGFRFSE